MISFKQYINEYVRKGTWEHLLSRDKEDYHTDLISLVDTAYKHTTLGSFVKNVQDVKSSDWLVLDYDNEPDLDTAIFYRGPRSNEAWKGFKIQGIGHNGTPEAKVRMMTELVKVLGKDGYWIEASERMDGALRKAGVNIYTKEIKKIFPSITKMNADGSYYRKNGDSVVHETCFGHPKL